MDKREKIEHVGEIYDAFQAVHERFFDFWYHHTFLQWDWWISLGLGVASWVLWFWVRPNASTQRLLYAGTYMMLISLFLDYIGVALGLWYYTGKLTPTMPAYLPFNFAALPVVTMLLLQWRPWMSKHWKGLIFGLFNGYVGEPLFVWAGFYVMTGWQYYYSIPIYYLLFLVAHAIAHARTYEPLPTQR